MLKKIWSIFLRDLRVNSRDFLSLYLILAPVLFAFVINMFVPGVNDTTVNLALLDNDVNRITYLEEFADIEIFESVEMIKERIEKRDDIVGIIPDGQESYIMIHGDESEGVVEYAKLLNTLYDTDSQIEDTTVELIDFGRTVPPVKKMLVNMLILITSVLGGMIIAFNIIEEKVDNTISAVFVTPVSHLGFIIGKTIMGLFIPIFGTITLLYLVGFGDVNLGQIGVVIVVTTIISILLGFIEGVTNDDAMSAAATLKLLFIPLMGSVAGLELLADKWQKFFYWSPFYWAYKANDGILSYSGIWSEILAYCGILLVISGVIFAILAPKIKRGLN